MPDDLRSDDIAGAGDAGIQAELSSGSGTADDHGTAEPRPRVAGGDGGERGGTAAIPFPDHQRVVDGFHERLDRLSWASAYDPQDVREAFELAGKYRQLETSRRSAEPEPDVEDERGERFYSPRQAAALVKHAVADAIAELREEYDERFTPLEHTVRESSRANALSFQIERATSWPGFNDHIDAITDAIAAANRRHERLDLRDAYIEVVAPKLSASEETLEAKVRQKILTEMEQNVSHSDVHPRRQPSGSRKRDQDKSWKELIGEEVARQTATSR